jgi:poly(3-hydroxybutyrate) depolymerase
VGIIGVRYNFFVQKLYLTLLIAALGPLAACSKAPVELGAADYRDAVTPACATSEPGGIHDHERTDGGIHYSVRTPSNYDPSVAHPLLVVYAAAGQSRSSSERFTGLTRSATAAGFIIAYADHRRLSIRVLDDLATIPDEVAKKWCVDPGRVFLTGHSDGGTAAAAMAFRPDDGLEPAGIAASAAGITGADLEAYQCPGPLRVMILHSREDEHFPGFGADLARWWARCQQCKSRDVAVTAGACLDYDACAGGVRYCEGHGGHRRWPAINDEILDFFSMR